MKVKAIIKNLLIWRIRHIDDKKFILFLSVIVGFLAGISAVIIKNAVHFIQSLLQGGIIEKYHNYLYFILPAFGILIAVLFIRYILRRSVGHGIPTLLFSISKANGKIPRHNMFSSIITSAFTVGFGGSVGLEGPTVATGAAYGSNLGHYFHLNYRQVSLILACAGAGAMSAIFKAPIAAIVFVIEVLMLDLTLTSLLPLLFASVTAAITSYLFLGMDVLYPVKEIEEFLINEIPFYILLGVITGLVSVYFARCYKYIQKKFELINNGLKKWLIGGSILGLLIFLFPSLYGEGYDAINSALHGNHSYLFDNSIFSGLQENIILITSFFLLVIIFKVVATAVTFEAGGVGGIFAPTLFIGANTGLLFAYISNYLGIKSLALNNYTLVGMAGLIAGVLHAPLTAIFLIAETTGGYALFIPLMIVSTISYATIKIFETHSVYTYQLANKGELFTHDKDKVILSILTVNKLIETNFLTINKNASLGDLVKVISKSCRNIVPVVDNDNNLFGIVFINDVRHIIFKPELYEKIMVSELMYMPSPAVHPKESMEDVAKKFQTTEHYNLPVIENGKYKGFVSRANVFSAYRKLLKEFSDD
ncbi:MAG: chloride channel protein [Bacteroidota bacterium]|nr:chloride channel protein [Bacteroidota bacterium]